MVFWFKLDCVFGKNQSTVFNLSATLFKTKNKLGI